MPLLSQQSELSLILKAQGGDQKAIDCLFSAHDKYLETIASRFTIPGFDVEDIRIEAVCGFMRAIHTFKPGKDVNFTTNIYNTVTGYLKNRLRKVVGRTKEGSFATGKEVSYQIATATNFSGLSTDSGGAVEEHIEDKAFDSSLGVSPCSRFEDAEFRFMHERVLASIVNDNMRTVYLLLIEGTTLPEIEKMTGLTKNQVFSLRERLKPIIAQIVSNY